MAALCLFAVLSVLPGQAQIVTTLIQFTNTWKYDASGRDLGVAWQTNGYDDSDWLSGAGLLGNEPDTPQGYLIHARINTPIPTSSTVTTFYFRTTFNLLSQTNALSLFATNLVDDGCAIYLNGLLAGAVRAPAGVYNATTFFGGPAMEGQLDVVALTNLGALRIGQNLLAVEVHQASSASLDIMWGMKLMAIQQIPLVITNQPQSQTVSVGDFVSLTVGVSGEPASYRWFRDSVVQPSTSNTLKLPNIQLAAAGNYRVIITNSISAVTSSVATLTVFADLSGPRLTGAMGNPPSLPLNSVLLTFSEVLNQTSAREIGNYSLRSLRSGNTVSLTNALYSSAAGVWLFVDATDSDWVPMDDYIATVNGVTDFRGNAIAPDSQVTVNWSHTTTLIASDAVWDFHASAIFEPEVFDEDWFACDFIPTFWWGLGQGPFWGGVVGTDPCLQLGTLKTHTGYQPEPALYRTTFHWPTHWPSTGTLKIAAAFDDALVLYLDGREIYRTNAGTAGSSVRLESRAAGALSVCTTNLAIVTTNVQPGLHWLAASVLQSSIDADSVFALRMEGIASLSPAQPEQPAPVLSLVVLDADSSRISWVGGSYVLESTTNLSLGSVSYPAGPWQQVAHMSNPYTNRLDGMQRFFRLKK